MQEYGEVFARVYNSRWAGFATRVAPSILDFYAHTAGEERNQSILDLCCGTGQFSIEALKRGYDVVGVDASEAMLHYAEQNSGCYTHSGKASFLRADARSFELDRSFGLAVALYDSLNHLDDEADLQSCFWNVHQVVIDGGYFVFDLNTRARLEKWAGITVTDEEEMMVVSRSMYVQEHRKAYARISGFVRGSDGRYERFCETFFNTAFELTQVKDLLLEVGWKSVYFAREQDLTTSLDEPENEDRVFAVASK